MLKQTIKLSIQSTSIIGRVGQLVIDLEEVGVDPPYVIPSVHGMRARCKHLVDSADVAAAGAPSLQL